MANTFSRFEPVPQPTVLSLGAQPASTAQPLVAARAPRGAAVRARRGRLPIATVAGALLAALALLVSGDAAADGMRCGNRLVSKGDTQYKVRSVCGDPDATDRRVITRRERRRVNGPCYRDDRGHVRCEQSAEVAVDVVIDEWTYDFGTQRFVHHVIFEDGHLIRVVTGGYGYKTSAD